MGGGNSRSHGEEAVAGQAANTEYRPLITAYLILPASTRHST